MPLLSHARTLVLIALVPLALAACGKEEDAVEKAPPSKFGAEEGLLQYVADDSPYVFAMLEPAPDDVMVKLEPQIDVTLKSYRTIIQAVLREEMESDDDQSEKERAQTERVIAVIDELSDLFSLEGIRNAGIGRDSTMVFYGAGLAPVLRVALSEAGAFEETLARIEAEAGAQMTVGEIDGQSYRYAGDDKGRFILALVGGDLVVSIVPTASGDDGLREVLGLTKPATSLASTGRLQNLAADNGFTAYGAGYADIERIVSVFVDDPSGINGELLAAMDYSSDALSPVCREEIRAMGRVAPRLLTGYTDLTAERIASNTILELRSDIAGGLTTLAAPVPGMGRDHGGLFSFGMSLDIMAAREFYSARLDALEKDPYECELFADLQAGVVQGRQMLSQPVPPVVNGLKGFLAIVENIEGMDIATKTPPTSIDMRLLVATDNAQGLLAMGSMFSPEIASLNLKPDGKPVRFESPQLQAAPIDAAYVAMNDKALALSLGAGTEAGLGELIAAPISEPPPFMSIHMDAARYYSFIGDAMKAGSEMDEKEYAPEVADAAYEIMQGIGELTDRFAFNVNFTERGIEFPTEMTLAE